MNAAIQRGIMYPALDINHNTISHFTAFPTLFEKKHKWPSIFCQLLKPFEASPSAYLCTQFYGYISVADETVVLYLHCFNTYYYVSLSYERLAINNISIILFRRKGP